MMKRILFYSENFCGENVKGGLEVATYRIAKALKETGKWEVYNAFRSKSDGKDKSTYRSVVKLGKTDKAFRKRLTDFILDNEIDIVVNMSRFFRHSLIMKSAKDSGRDIRIVFMQHFAPGSEMKKPTFKSGFHLLKLNPFNPSYWIRASLYPLLKMPRLLRFSKVYRETYEQSDRVVLLSEGYKEDYCRIGKFDDKIKFQAIQNIFEPVPIQFDDIKKKGKKVLILSRMDEIQKRLSVALQIWANIEKDTDLDDWHLDIVGSGHNSDIVKRLIKKLKLKNVTYHGWQPREKYLEEASILISTSEYEGLPLSILEAQAYGVVPVAFDSYASLRDVVEPFVNGVLIEKFGDIHDFTAKLKDLMFNEDYREELSKNAIENSSNFSSEKIVAEWNDMLKDL